MEAMKRGVTKGNLSLKTPRADSKRSTRGWGMVKVAFKRSHEIPSQSKHWVGIQIDFSQLATKPALTKSDRTVSEQD